MSLLGYRTDTRGATVAAIFFTIRGRDRGIDDDPVGTYMHFLLLNTRSGAARPIGLAHEGRGILIPFCPRNAPGKQNITMSVTNKAIRQNCTIAIRSGSMCVFAGEDHSGFAFLARNSVGIGSFPSVQRRKMYVNAIPDCDLGNSKGMAPTEQLVGGPSKNLEVPERNQKC
jgi:hypothetical protein